ncbi:MAG: HD domain-containing protein [bacterium]|nr:HD domain-containing protein [bacterium]
MNIRAFLEHVYEGKKRKTGAKASSHPIAVRKILVDEGIKEEAILNAALLHDVLEDTSITKEYLRLRFGDKVAELVDLVSKLSSWNTSYCKMKGSLDDMEQAWSVHPESVLIKMADRLHNLQTIHGFSPEKQNEYIDETNDMLLPLFERIIKNNRLSYLQKSLLSLYDRLEKETRKASNHHR